MNAFEAHLAEVGLSVSAFAEMIRRTPSTLWRLLRGERSPSLSVALDVERGTRGKVSADEFMAICAAERRRVMRAAAKAKAKRAAA